MILLIDEYLPEFQFNEYHSIQIAGSPSRIYPLLIPLDMNPSKLIKALFLLRGLPFKDIRLDRMIGSGPFELLDARENREILIGLLTDARLFPVTFSSGRAFKDDHSGLKIAWNFKLDQRTGATVLSTETRIQCMGKRAETFFRFYWTLIQPFSGLVRMEMLRLVKIQAEQDNG